MTDPDHAVLVARFNSRPEAEVARGFLEEAGISSVLQVDDGGGIFGAPLTFSLDSFAGVLVIEGDAEEARTVLQDAGYTTLDDEGEEVVPNTED